MTGRIEKNRQFTYDLFAGPFRGHGLVMTPELPTYPERLGDFSTSDRPLNEWIPWAEMRFAKQLEWHEALDDDSVPHIHLQTHTGVFAAAFGCEIHEFEGSNAAARPLVFSVEEADRLPMPDLNAAPLARVFEFNRTMQERIGRDVPVTVPDIQSPFDVAALIWNKEDLYLAMVENPEPVRRLVDKCHKLVKDFLLEFKRQFPECNLCHCPSIWTPPELGCSLSEDEVGCMSVRMFESFCLPHLIDLSETFGGMFMHCCANADLHYKSFTKIPKLRGLNRVFQYPPGPRPAIEAFSGTTVLAMAWLGEEGFQELLDLALPETRYLFNAFVPTLEQARPLLDRLRARCPRR